MKCKRLNPNSKFSITKIKKKFFTVPLKISILLSPFKKVNYNSPKIYESHIGNNSSLRYSRFIKKNLSPLLSTRKYYLDNASPYPP